MWNANSLFRTQQIQLRLILFLRVRRNFKRSLTQTNNLLSLDYLFSLLFLHVTYSAINLQTQTQKYTV